MVRFKVENISTSYVWWALDEPHPVVENPSGGPNQLFLGPNQAEGRTVIRPDTGYGLTLIDLGLKPDNRVRFPAM
jgi:hypothetical protein